jgi:hypothetical protein
MKKPTEYEVKGGCGCLMLAFGVTVMPFIFTAFIVVLIKFAFWLM